MLKFFAGAIFAITIVIGGYFLYQKYFPSDPKNNVPREIFGRCAADGQAYAAEQFEIVYPRGFNVVKSDWATIFTEDKFTAYTDVIVPTVNIKVHKNVLESGGSLEEFIKANEYNQVANLRKTAISGLFALEFQTQNTSSVATHTLIQKNEDVIDVFMVETGMSTISDKTEAAYEMILDTIVVR